ncbi:MAG: bacteriocin, partial [Calditrichaeota bacterium]
MDILKKDIMPITDSAWEELVEQAEITLKSTLTARKFVDVDGPKGWEFSAVPLGRLEFPKGEKNKNYGIRQVMPLVE